ncbi:hypothetical protein JTE90_020240 [Oedothorax gibbosus]|uniref:Uncharacterized protein n=1 Tax=Oedothorax gibbosus TaxID=931172 RepID=A0AAV6UYJ6_9ARAC|nr:hypothetical protein JTE90_020240 [Oedothorax gibbosus]
MSNIAAGQFDSGLKLASAEVDKCNKGVLEDPFIFHWRNTFKAEVLPNEPHKRDWTVVDFKRYVKNGTCCC